MRGKRVLIGITGSIAAYKAAFLVRELIKLGAEVKVIMTSDAKAFISPLTLATLSKNKVLSDLFDSSTGEWTNHVELGLWADIFVIAPATANTIAKMSNGICDNLLSAVYLSARCPVYFAPAMDLDMYAHPSTQKNIETLKSYGNILIEPGEGELASGLEGKGRMAEVEDIISILKKSFNSKLSKKKVLITAGPTYEKIDPVRFIGNFSSGKMGYRLAEAFAEKGAEVALVSGPSNETANHPNIKVYKVISADEMYNVCVKLFPKSDIAVMSAAVADYKPKKTAKNKIKKESADVPVIELTKNKDILQELGKIKKSKQTLIGFALEDKNEIANAKAKVERKNLDYIILNSLNDKGAGFGSDTNKVTLIDKNFKVKEFPLSSKYELAHKLVDNIFG